MATALLIVLVLLLGGIGLAAPVSASHVPLPSLRVSQSSTPAYGLPPGYPMFQGNPQLTGSAPSTVGQRVHVAWSTYLPVYASDDIPPYQSSPSVGYGFVFVDAADALYTFNATDGAAQGVYTVPTASTNEMLSTPLVDGTLITGAQANSPNNVYILNASGAGTATTCAVPNGGAAISSSPVPYPGGLLLADERGRFTTYSDATPVVCPMNPWESPGGEFFSTPALAYPKGVATYFDPNYGNGQIDGVVRATGANSPGFPIPITNTLLGSMSVMNVSNGKASYPVGFVGTATIDATASPQLIAVNLTSGALLGSLTLSPLANNQIGGILSTPSVVPGDGPNSVQVVYTTANVTADVLTGGTLSHATFTLTPTGGSWSDEWNVSTNDTFASPVVANGLAMAGNANGWFWAVSLANGAVVWKYDLGSPVLSGAAVAYGLVYVYTATGLLAALAPTPPPATLTVPATTTPGATVPVQVHVDALNATDVPGGGLAGAKVSLTVTGGTLSASSAITPANGTASFTWTAPANASAPVEYLFTASVTATGYGSTTVDNVTTVPATPPSPPLVVTATAASGTLLPGTTTLLTFLVANLSGSPITGASVVVTLTGAGTVNPSSTLTTGSNGLAQANYTAPGTLSQDQAVLVSATASEAGYLSATGSVALALVTGGTSGVGALSVSVAPAEATVLEGGQATFTIDVENATSHLPVQGATVTLSASPSSLGSFSLPSATGSSGTTTVTYTAADRTGTVLASLTASAPLYSPGLAAVALAVTSPSESANVLVLTATPASPSVVAGGSDTITLLGQLRNSTTGVLSGASGAVIVASVVSGPAHLTATSVTLNATGGATLVASTGLVDSAVPVLLSFGGAFSGALPNATSATFLVEPGTLDVSASVGSATVLPGGATRLAVTVTDGPTPVSGAWVNLTLAAGSDGSLSSQSAVTGSNGTVDFLFTAGSATNDVVSVGISVAAPGYEPATSTAAIAVVASTAAGSTSSSTAAVGGLSWLDLALLLLVILLAILLAVALMRRRNPPAGPSGLAAVPSHEYDESVGMSGPALAGAPMVSGLPPETPPMETPASNAIDPPPSGLVTSETPATPPATEPTPQAVAPPPTAPGEGAPAAVTARREERARRRAARAAGDEDSRAAPPESPGSGPSP